MSRYLLNAHGVKLKDVVFQTPKRELKGGAGTVDKVMTAKVIDTALKEMDITVGSPLYDVGFITVNRPSEHNKHRYTFHQHKKRG